MMGSDADAVAAIQSDLSERVLDGAPVEVEPVPESHSGFTYTVLVGGAATYVLRLPPPGIRPVGPADVHRQARIMRALRRRGVPVPAVVVDGRDGTSVDGRPFVLMERLEGQRVEDAIDSTFGPRLVSAAIELLETLRGVPPSQTGISEEPPVSPHEDVRRWSALARRASEYLPDTMQEVEEVLLKARPSRRELSIVHGDYHLGNMLFEGDVVTGLLDWEISHLGEPAFDAAALCLVGIRREFPGPNPGGEVDMSLEEILQLFPEVPPDMDWYLAATCHKYAAILAYNLRLHRTGRRPDPRYDEVSPTIRGLARAARDLLG